MTGQTDISGLIERANESGDFDGKQYESLVFDMKIFIETQAKRIAEMEMAHDAIEAATVDRCLAVIPGGNICDPQTIADDIRALKRKTP